MRRTASKPGLRPFGRGGGVPQESGKVRISEDVIWSFIWVFSFPGSRRNMKKDEKERGGGVRTWHRDYVQKGVISIMRASQDKITITIEMNYRNNIKYNKIK